MLRSLADLLDSLREKEVQALAQYHDLNHPGMIGDMYEGLTRQVLTDGLLDGLDLRVVTGKVRMDDGSYSDQMDAMVVRGEGEPVPFTDHWVYPPEQVIAAIEVKKTLYAAALDEAYQNLRSHYHKSYLKHAFREHLDFAFRKVAKAEIPDDGDLNRLSWERQMVAHALMWDVSMPVRIVFGYSGYGSEYALREGLADYLSRVTKFGGARGYGPAAFPNLIVSGTNSLVKQNGMPYSMQGPNAAEWLFYASRHGNSGLLMLEVIWTRLQMLGLISADAFGDDLEIEHLNPLFGATPVHASPSNGWEYRYEAISKKMLERSPDFVAWEPLQLTDHETILMNHLLPQGSVDTRTSSFWEDWKAQPGTDAERTLAALRAAGIAAVDDHGVLALTTEACQVFYLPSIGWFAAENSTGRLTRWVKQRWDRKRSGNERAAEES